MRNLDAYKLKWLFYAFYPLHLAVLAIGALMLDLVALPWG